MSPPPLVADAHSPGPRVLCGARRGPSSLLRCLCCGCQYMGCERKAGAGQLDLQMAPQPPRGAQGETPALFTEISPQCQAGETKAGWGHPVPACLAFPSPTPMSPGKGLLSRWLGPLHSSPPSSLGAPQLPGGVLALSLWGPPPPVFPGTTSPYEIWLHRASRHWGPQTPDL